MASAVSSMSHEERAATLQQMAGLRLDSGKCFGGVVYLNAETSLG